MDLTPPTLLNLIKDSDLETVKKFAESKGRIPDAYVDRVHYYKRYKNAEYLDRKNKEYNEILDKAVEDRKMILKRANKDVRRRAKYKARKKIEKSLQDEVDKLKPVADFMSELMKNGGNITEAAWASGRYKNRSSAGVGGQNLIRKAKAAGLFRIYMEHKGYNFAKMMDVAMEKMEGSKKPDWWDRLMKMAGYENFVTKEDKGSQVNVNIFNDHEKFIDDYVIDAEVVEDDDER